MSRPFLGLSVATSLHGNLGSILTVAATSQLVQASFTPSQLHSSMGTYTLRPLGLRQSV